MCGWLGHSAKIVSCSPMRLQDIWEDIRAVASACGVPERGEPVVASLQQRVRDISETAEHLPNKLRIACIEWLEPLMSAGNWVPELVTMAGGINLFGEPGVHSPWFSWEELQASDPDMLIILACGFSLQRTESEMPALTGHPAWSTLRAVQQGHVYITDGNQYFNRPGPRLVESLEILAEIFHPSQFNFGHAGHAWKRFSTSIPQTE